jgi:hypothetical protein
MVPRGLVAVHVAHDFLVLWSGTRNQWALPVVSRARLYRRNFQSRAVAAHERHKARTTSERRDLRYV